MNWLFSKAILWIAGILLTAQGVVIAADFFIATWIFDEIISGGINVALVWLIAKQRRLHNASRSAA